MPSILAPWVTENLTPRNQLTLLEALRECDIDYLSSLGKNPDVLTLNQYIKAFILNSDLLASIIDDPFSTFSISYYFNYPIRSSINNKDLLVQILPLSYLYCLEKALKVISTYWVSDVKELLEPQLEDNVQFIRDLITQKLDNRDNLRE